VGGGYQNVAGGLGAFVGGGGWAHGLSQRGNTAGGNASAIVGGIGNRIEPTADFAFVGGGADNCIWAGAENSFLGGGSGNSIQTNATYSVLGGGLGNTIQRNALYSTIVGGNNNFIQTDANASVLVGGTFNSIQTSRGSVIVGGYYNSIQTNAYYSFLGGGWGNTIQSDAEDSFLGGGSLNSIQTDAINSFLGGGRLNEIQTNTSSSVLCGGYGNSIQANGGASFLGGGSMNSIQTNASYAVLGGGYGNSIQRNANHSFLGGGSENTVGGSYAVVPGGDRNSASGVNSFAAGHRAKADSPGMFVWADSWNADFQPHDYGFWTNTFAVRATGGSVWITSTNGTMGPYFVPGDLGWRSSCDRNLKENFKPVDSQAVLERLSRLPITEWNAKAQSPSVRHIGPVAQDFHAAFGLGGNDDKSISSIDECGVALVAIQGLNQKVEDQRAELKSKQAEIDELKQRLARLEKLVLQSNGN
jgi:hypothetical protein